MINLGGRCTKKSMWGCESVGGEKRGEIFITV